MRHTTTARGVLALLAGLATTAGLLVTTTAPAQAGQVGVTVGIQGAGTVEAIGDGVTRYAVGDRVGVGCFVDSCRECENCLAGEEQFCLKGNVPTYNGRGYDGEETKGGYAQRVVVSERIVVRVPDGIGLDEAAPRGATAGDRYPDMSSVHR